MIWGRLITPQTAVILCFNAHIITHKYTHTQKKE